MVIKLEIYLKSFAMVFSVFELRIKMNIIYIYYFIILFNSICCCFLKGIKILDWSLWASNSHNSFSILGTIEMDQVVLVEVIGDEREGCNVDLMSIVDSSWEGEGSVVDLIHEHSVQSQLHVLTNGKVDKIAIFPWRLLQMKLNK